MSIAALLLIILAVVVLVALVWGVVLVLLKLGVIVRYAVQEEPQDHGTYQLDQSEEAGE